MHDAVKQRLEVRVLFHPLLGNVQNNVHFAIGSNRRCVVLVDGLLEVPCTGDIKIPGHICHRLAVEKAKNTALRIVRRTVKNPRSVIAKLLSELLGAARERAVHLRHTVKDRCAFFRRRDFRRANWEV